MNKKHLAKLLITIIIVIGILTALSVPAFAETVRPHTALDIAPPWVILVGFLLYPFYILFWLIVNIGTVLYQAFAQIVFSIIDWYDNREFWCIIYIVLHDNSRHRIGIAFSISYVYQLFLHFLNLYLI